MIKSNNSWIIPEQTNIELLEDLIIPANVSLTIEADSKIKIKEGKSIVIYGDLFIKGTNNKPVIFSSLGSKPWGGLFAGGTSNKKSTVEINSAIFKDFGSFPKTKINKMNLNGGLTFYKTKLIADNIRIENALSEDGMNIIYSQAKISNLSLKNSYSDGIDLDYTDADIKNIQIENNRGDGLDISGSLVKCSFCIFLNNKDKGVSIGEMSNFYANNSIFMNNDMGLANKDQSVVNLSNSLLKNNRIGLAEFIKKPYFGKPKSNLLENKYINNNFDYKWLGLYFY